MQNLKDKVVIITGASSGIGEATAYKLAKAGAKLVLGARREDRLKAIVAMRAQKKRIPTDGCFYRFLQIQRLIKPIVSLYIFSSMFRLVKLWLSTMKRLHYVQMF